jgi:hypothetical protein
MSWTSYVDTYCERVAPGFWGEPLNAVSNLGFLAAAIGIWFFARSTAPRGYPLAVLIALIFLGSTALHTTATYWGGTADVFFIGVFLLYYVVLFPHLFWGMPLRRAWLALPVFAVVTGLVALATTWLIGSSGTYLSSLVALIVMATSLKGSPYRRFFWAAAGVFAVSVTLRSIDQPVCGAIPIGTHWAWHLLNAVVLYLVSRAAIIRWRELSA